MAIDYGQDLSCVNDLTPHMVVVSGLRLVAEAIARRLITPKGALLDDPNYGYDLPGQLNSDIQQGDLGRIAAAVSAECQKDQRIQTAATTVTWVPQQGTSMGYATVTISLVTGRGPFTLVLSATQITVTILSIDN